MKARNLEDRSGIRKAQKKVVKSTNSEIERT